MIDRVAEAGRYLRVRRVVGGGVRFLADGHLVDPVAGAGRHDGEQLHEAGADARPEHRRSPAFACGHDSVPVATERVAGDEGGRAHDVDARLEDADELVDVAPHGVVHDAVGLQGEQGAAVRPGRHDVVGLVPGIDHHGLIGFGVADQVAVALELPNDQMLVDLECHGYNLPRRRRAPVPRNR